jgi:hypothetical protein
MIFLKRIGTDLGTLLDPVQMNYDKIYYFSSTRTRNLQIPAPAPEHWIIYLCIVKLQYKCAILFTAVCVFIFNLEKSNNRQIKQIKQLVHFLYNRGSAA